MNILPKKVLIIGTSGSGKTTFGRELSKILKIPSTELDNLFWLPHWQKREEHDFLHLLKNKSASEQWIFCGNYTQHLQTIRAQADMIIWLDMPLLTCLWRSLKRSLQRIIDKKPCCNGNYETLGRLVGKDSILLWVWNSYSRRKKAYEIVFSNNQSNQQLIRLRNNQEIKEFLASLDRN